MNTIINNSDLLTHIFSFVEPYQLLKNNEVSKLWKKIAESEPLWKSLCCVEWGNRYISDCDGLWKKRFQVLDCWKKGLFSAEQINSESEVLIKHGLQISEDSNQLTIKYPYTNKIITLNTPLPESMERLQIEKSLCFISYENCLKVFDLETGQLKGVPILIDDMTETRVHSKYVATKLYHNSTIRIWDMESYSVLDPIEIESTLGEEGIKEYNELLFEEISKVKPDCQNDDGFAIWAQSHRTKNLKLFGIYNDHIILADKFNNFIITIIINIKNRDVEVTKESLSTNSKIQFLSPLIKFQYINQRFEFTNKYNPTFTPETTVIDFTKEKISEIWKLHEGGYSVSCCFLENNLVSVCQSGKLNGQVFTNIHIWNLVTKKLFTQINVEGLIERVISIDQDKVVAKNLNGLVVFNFNPNKPLEIDKKFQRQKVRQIQEPLFSRLRNLFRRIIKFIALQLEKFQGKCVVLKNRLWRRTKDVTN